MGGLVDKQRVNIKPQVTRVVATQTVDQQVERTTGPLVFVLLDKLLPMQQRRACDRCSEVWM